MGDDDVRARLRAGLGAAMKARDRVAVAVLRSTLGAIDNAEAVDDAVDAPIGGVIAKSLTGLGAGEAPRRDLSEDEVLAILRHELEERRTAAHEYRSAGHPDHATRLDTEADLLATYL
jgi:uncharacterized protein YqeY